MAGPPTSIAPCSLAMEGPPNAGPLLGGSRLHPTPHSASSQCRRYEISAPAGPLAHRDDRQRNRTAKVAESAAMA